MRRGFGAALAAAVLAVAGCRPAKPPVAALEVRPARFELAWPEFTEIELTFEPVAELPEGDGAPIVFLHLLDEPGSVVRTFDHLLPGPWRVGRPLSYRVRLYQSALAEPLEAGEYMLSAGIYRPGGERYALRTAAEEIAKLEYQVATVGVAAPGARMPHARFSEHWLPSEPGADRQVLARRALAGGAEGTIQFGPVEGAGRLHLGFVVPADGPGSRVEVLGGGSLPKVRIASSCGGGQPEVSGSGRLDVDLELPPAAGPRLCEITIAPNFQVTTPDRAEPTSIRLELLAWERVADAPAD